MSLSFDLLLRNCIILHTSVWNIVVVLYMKMIRKKNQDSFCLPKKYFLRIRNRSLTFLLQTVNLRKENIFFGVVSCQSETCFIYFCVTFIWVFSFLIFTQWLSFFVSPVYADMNLLWFRPKFLNPCHLL